MNNSSYLKLGFGIILTLVMSITTFAQGQGGVTLDKSIKGSNVGMVVEKSAQSQFTWEQIGDKIWKCTNTTANRKQGIFSETGRDEWSVYLTNNKTSRKFQIDLHTKKVYDRSTGQETSGDIIKVSLRPVLENGATYKIILKSQNKVLDVYRSRTSDRAEIGTYSYFGSDNQHFVAKAKGNGYYSFVAVHSGKAIDVSDTVRGAAVFQWKYHGGSNQLFKLNAKGSSYYTVECKQTKQVLDMTAAGKLIQYTAHGGDNQLFKFVKIK